MLEQAIKTGRLLVASEYADPAFHVDYLKERLDAEQDSSVGLLLITKDVESVIPVMEHASKLKIPTILHATITGLAGTTLEPNVPAYDNNIVAIRNVMRYLGDRQEVVLRVDPLIPGVTSFQEIDYIAHLCSDLGVKRCRTSVIDYYPFVRTKMDKAEYPTYPDFQAPEEVIRGLLSSMLAICEKYGLRMELCAERFEAHGDFHRGCADKNDWCSLGLELPLSESRQRRGCFCNVPKHDVLRGKECRHGCLYCYWGKYKSA